MGWRDLLFPATKPSEDVERTERSEQVLSEVEDFLLEMRRDIRNFQRTADDDRLGYPIAGAVRRRRRDGGRPGSPQHL